MAIVLRFDPVDPLRVRFAVSQLWETLAAVRALRHQRSAPHHRAWVQRVRGPATGLDLQPLLAVQPQVGYTPDLLSPPPLQPRASFVDELARLRTTPVESVRAELARCRDQPNPGREVVDGLLADPSAGLRRLVEALDAAWTVLVAPYWPAMLRLFDADLAYRSRQLTEGGLEELFADLHASVSRHGNELHIRRPFAEHRDLAGAGLLLTPSAFIGPHPAAFVDPPYQPALVYPVRGIARLWTSPARPADAVTRLLGTGRAAVLHGLAEPSTTGSLAAHLGLSAGTVSEHLGVLRAAGLVDGTRVQHRVVYRLTSLGQALLDGGGAPAGPSGSY